MRGCGGLVSYAREDISVVEHTSLRVIVSLGQTCRHALEKGGELQWVRMVAAEEEWEGKVSVQSGGVGVQGASEAAWASGVGVKSQQADMDDEDASDPGLGGVVSGKSPGAVDGERRGRGADAGGAQARVAGAKGRGAGEVVSIAKVMRAGRVREVQIGGKPVGERAKWYVALFRRREIRERHPHSVWARAEVPR